MARLAGWLHPAAAAVRFLLCAAAIPAAPAVADEPLRLEGVLAAVGSELAFAPCEGTAAPARDATADADLAAVVAAMEGHPRGTVAIDADLAWRGDHWELLRLRRARTGTRSCEDDRADYNWRAEGGDGRWALEVTPRRLLLRHRGEPVPVSFRYRPFDVVAPGVLVFQAAERGASIHVVLRSGRCGGAATGRITDYAIELTWRGIRYEGCAWNGDPR